MTPSVLNSQVRNLPHFDLKINLAIGYEVLSFRDKSDQKGWAKKPILVQLCRWDISAQQHQDVSICNKIYQKV